MLTHVDEWWFMMIYDVARRSMFCQLRVLGRMPLRLINVWQSFGKDCQGCADCTTWKTWISCIMLGRIDTIWSTAPLVFLIFSSLIMWRRCDTLWHVAPFVQYLGNTLHLVQIAPRLINVWHGEAPCSNVGHVGYVDFSSWSNWWEMTHVWETCPNWNNLGSKSIIETVRL